MKCLSLPPPVLHLTGNGRRGRTFPPARRPALPSFSEQTQHLTRDQIVHRARRVQIIRPEVLVARHTAAGVVEGLVGRALVSLARIRRIPENARDLEAGRIIQHLVE